MTYFFFCSSSVEVQLCENDANELPLQTSSHVCRWWKKKKVINTKCMEEWILSMWKRSKITGLVFKLNFRRKRIEHCRKNNVVFFTSLIRKPHQIKINVTIFTLYILRRHKPQNCFKFDTISCVRNVFITFCFFIMERRGENVFLANDFHLKMICIIFFYFNGIDCPWFRSK